MTVTYKTIHNVKIQIRIKTNRKYGGNTRELYSANKYVY